MNVLARKALGFVGTVAEALADNGPAGLFVDGFGALWTRTLDPALGPPVAAGIIAGAGSATSPWSAQTAEAYLTLNAPSSNANAVYYGASGVSSSTGLPIYPGQSRQVRLANPALAFAYVSSGDTCGWAVER